MLEPEQMWIKGRDIRGYVCVIRETPNYVVVSSGNNQHRPRKEDLYAIDRKGGTGHCPHETHCTFPATYWVPSKSEWFCGEPHEMKSNPVEG